jgi:AAA+ superfamily predicted ATPase
VPPILWDAARGEIVTRPTPWCEYAPATSFPSIDELIAAQDLIARLKKLPGLVAAGITRMLILRGVQGSNTNDIVGSVAAAMERGLITVDGDELAKADEAPFLGALCTMSHSVPLLNYDLAPGETVEPPRLVGYDGPIGIYLGMEGGLSSHLTEKAVTLNLKAPDEAQRVSFWQRALGRHEVEDIAAIAERFHIPGGYIRQVAGIAVAHASLDGRGAVSADDVQQASRTLNRQMLDTLAEHLETKGQWSDLVASESTGDKLQELEQRCRYRERLLGHLGPAFNTTTNRGVRALFTGASGTGKTLAAKILAAELGMDLYRVDLAAIINKYIGETEKNLHRVLSRAEALDVMLLLDEGDALLGHRTDVKSANDRYANLETNYLLQRLENYQGIVLITTNLVENIDRAFQRRMDVVVPFFAPQAIERLHILQLHLPTDHKVEPDYLELVAQRCALTGGQIRSAGLHASLLALDENIPLDRYHLEGALRSEYRKAGGTFPLELSGSLRERDGGMGGLVAALSSR